MAKTSNSTSKKTAESFTLEVKDEDHYTLLSVRDIAERFGMSILTDGFRGLQKMLKLI